MSGKFKIEWTSEALPPQPDDVDWGMFTYLPPPVDNIPPCEHCGSDEVFGLQVQEAWVVLCLACKNQQDWEGPDET